MTNPAGLSPPQIPGMPVRGNAISVSELNRRARKILEANLELLWVAGELSNVTRAASGHWYFSLKDRDAQVRCVMFRNRAVALGFLPEAGMQVEVRALPSLYEARGDFQLGVETMRRAGLGALFEAFEKLKAKLQAEGLFAAERKRDLPRFPRTIGVVTSLQAAALRDVLTTLQRRAPMIPIIIYPTTVQGQTAAADIAGALDAARLRAEVDVVILCRGGGSIEDLWSFNEESVARAIARFQDESGIPLVAGVGHETDFSIADFVADRRAPTPTAAAEMVSPDAVDLRAVVAGLSASLRRNLLRKLDAARQRVDHAQRGLQSPTQRIAREHERLAALYARLSRALLSRATLVRYQVTLLGQRLQSGRPDVSSRRSQVGQRQARLLQARDAFVARQVTRVDQARRSLELLDPSRVLERGYAIVEIRGAVLRDAANAEPGDTLAVRLSRGAVTATVINKS